MENNEKDFENGSAPENSNESTDPFASADPFASTDPFGSEDPFASMDNGYTRVTNNGSYVQPPREQENQGFAIASMVLGIISLVCCCLGWISAIMAILSIIFGVITLVKKKPGKGMAIAGIICSSFAIVIYIVLVVISLAIGSSLSHSDIQELERYLENL